MPHKHPYATMDYAHSLAHWGKAMFVPEWNAPVIVRSIGQSGQEDAAGVYPFVPLAADADIAGGLERLRAAGMVSVVLVTDAFHSPPIDVLTQHFTTVRPLKRHYIWCPHLGDIHYHEHHRRAVRKAQDLVRTEVVEMKHHVGEWHSLYDALIEKLSLTGLHAFPRAHHDALAAMDGVVLVGAWQGDEMVSGHVWVSDGEYAHSHLVASNDKGYECRAGFAVNDASMHYFRNHKAVNWGGAAGYDDDADDGLARFKRGFSNAEDASWLCTAVLDEVRYCKLVEERNFSVAPSFFPAYRAP